MGTFNRYFFVWWAGLIIGHMLPENLFRFWHGKNINEKPSVYFIGPFSQYNFLCSKKTVIAMQAVSEENLAWVLMEECRHGKSFMIEINQEYLSPIQ